MVYDVSPVHKQGGRKRRRGPEEEKGPCVDIQYRNLSKESLQRLHEALEDWSTWQSTHAKLVWEELPSRHVASTGASVPSSSAFNLEYEADNSVPMYDRLVDGPLGEEEDGSVIPKEASRCWNCSSYSHSLRECRRPRDPVAIREAREEQQATRGGGPMPRYHGAVGRDAPKDFADLKPGVLSSAVREALGIGEAAPPPWLHRMKHYGYPPGYMGYVADEADVRLTIFDEAEAPLAEVREDVEEGEMSPPPLLPTPEGPPQPLVQFPGINTPPPPGSDAGEWGWGESGLLPTPPALEDRGGGWGRGDAPGQEYQHPPRLPYPHPMLPHRYPYVDRVETDLSQSVNAYLHASQLHLQARQRYEMPNANASANAAWSLAVESYASPSPRGLPGIWGGGEGGVRQEMPDMDISDG